MKRAVIALAMTALPVAAVSDGPSPAPYDRAGVAFAIHVGREKQTFQYPNGTEAETTLERISATWYEHVAPGIELGLAGGKLFLYQTGNPSTAGVEPDGYHAGVALRAALFRVDSMQLSMRIRYDYLRVDYDGAAQSIKLAWYQPSAELAASLSPIGRLSFFGGARWSNVDGREHVSGASPTTTEFESSTSMGAFLGLDFTVDRGGSVGFEARSGAQRGGEIYFARRY